MSEFTHFTSKGDAQMVDVSGKNVTLRKAIAKGRVFVADKTLQKIAEQGFDKGDVLSIAQLAGIMGAKQTSQLIPLCHPIALSKVEVALNLNLDEQCVDITAKCNSSGQTGVEMEALTAVSVAALTIYDMCKSVDKHMQISQIRLTHKSGGKSGVFDGT